MLNRIKRYFNPFSPLWGKKKIALLYYDFYPAVENIHAGFISSLVTKYNENVFFVSFNAHGCKDRLIDITYEIAQQEFDLIFSIGSECTRLLKSVVDKKKIKTPVVFCDVKDPVALGIVSSYSHSKTNFTGVVTLNESYEEHFEHLLQLKPELKHATILYDEHEERAVRYKNCSSVRNYLRSKNIEMQAVAISNCADTLEKLVDSLSANPTDVLFGLKQPLIMSNTKSLSQIAAQFNAPFFSCDLSSINNGAAISCGSKDYKIGKEAGYKASLILNSDAKPENIPVSLMSSSFQLRACPVDMHKQGMHLCKNGRAWLEANGRLEKSC